jgi:hypothetical protein
MDFLNERSALLERTIRMEILGVAAGSLARILTRFVPATLRACNCSNGNARSTCDCENP